MLIIKHRNKEHFDKESALYQISKMYYTSGEDKIYGPYWSESSIKNVYDTLQLDDVNLYDFMVALNMIKSDYHNLLIDWFGEESDSKYIELTLNWLDDSDNPYGKHKIWKYFHSK